MSELKPVAWQFKNADGEWRNGTEHHNHYENTVDAGYEVRYLYAIHEGYALVPKSEIESAANALAYSAHPYESPHAKELREYLKDAQFKIGSVVDEEV